MTTAHPDPFDDFARRHELEIEIEELYSAPRDVAAPPVELERHVLVTLSRIQTAMPPVRALFVLPPESDGLPSMRDLLWWLACDAWAVEQADHRNDRWAAIHGYPANERASLRLFQLHERQASALGALLGNDGYRELLELHHGEIQVTLDPSRSRLRVSS